MSNYFDSLTPEERDEIRSQNEIRKKVLDEKRELLIDMIYRLDEITLDELISEYIYE